MIVQLSTEPALSKITTERLSHVNALYQVHISELCNTVPNLVGRYDYYITIKVTFPEYLLHPNYTKKSD